MNLVKSQDTKLIHRNLLHCYAVKKKKRSEREIKKTFTTATTTTKYLGINLESLLIFFRFFFPNAVFFLNFIYFLSIYSFGCAGHAGSSIFSCRIWDLVP